MLLSLNKNPNNHNNNNGLPYKRSSNTQKSLSSFAIRWGVTVLVINAALINQTNGFKTVSGESRKLFGGYRITPKQCRATKTLPSSDPRAKGPTICMFNHECAQRNGEVVGACMDGFLFGACCQVPKNQQPEHTLINDAQNSYYHQYQNQKIQQQETETNKIVSQAYETFAENSAQQQQLLENSQTENTGYGSTISNNVIAPSAAYNQESLSEEINTSTGTSSSTYSVAESAESEAANNSLETNYITESQTSLPSEPPKININQESVKVSSPSQTPQSDDFVLHVLSTLPPKGGNKIIAFATEVPTKISGGTTEHISSESNSFEEEAMAATKKPETMSQTAAAQPLQPEENYHTESAQPQNSEHHTEVLHDETEELFGGASFTHSDITHPGADTELIEDDLQFSTGYGPQPVFVPAPHKSPESYSQDNNKHNSHILDATTSSSSITTHVDSIETIIQQLNNNDSNPGPAYSVINHHEQHQQQPQHEEHYLQSSTYDNKLEIPTKRPVLYNEEENNKHTSLASFSYNEIQQNDKPDPVNLYGQTSSSTILSYAPHTSESTTVNNDEFILEDHTIPHSNYNDFEVSKHPTSDFNKMPPIGIAYPVDMSYIEEEGELESAVQHAPQHQNNQISNLSIKNQHQQQNDKDTHANTEYQPSQQQQNSQSNENKISQSPTVSNYVVETHQQQQPLATYSSTQHDEQNLSHPQTIETFVTEIHQRPISSYVGMVTSQSYNPQPVPNEVVVSSHTTKIEENAEVSTEYKPIITTNQIITTYKTTKKPVQHTSYTRRPTIVTKKPSSYKKPAQANNQRPTTNTYVSTNSIITQQHYTTKPIETKITSPAEPLYSKPTVSYNQGIKQNYIISSGSTPRPIVTRKPTKKQNGKPASTSYITGPTTPRPLVTPALQYGQEVSIIQADDKLDSFVHSTAESLAAATPTHEAVSYDPPVFISAGSLNQNQRPQYSTHKKPGFVKVSPTQRPPAPTVLITPKPNTLQSSATSLTTAHHTTALLPGYGSTSLVYNSLITKRPDFIENSAGDYMGISTVNSNDFDDPGYYGAVDHIKPGNPLYVSGSTDGIYPIPTDDKPAFPGYYGPTPTYPAFHVPGEKLESPIDDGVYTSINDFINFPPVRNPNLSLSATSSVVTNDFDLSTPAFVEDKILKNKMNTLVHKIVESLQGNFEALAEMIDDNNTTAVQTYQAAALNSTLVTKKPTRKPATKTTTVKPKVTTKKTVTRVTTKKTATTRKPDTTSKRPAAKRTTTTTKRPATRKPTRKTTTTKAPIDYDLADEEDEEDINPSDNEILEEDESYGAGGSGRKIQCGMRPQIKSGRIVGGKDAAFGAYPWQVLVRESMWLGLFTKNKCGGVLITNRYVITAAHCQTGFLAYLVAVMGEFDISGDLESKRAITKNVKRVIVHRQYDPATFENDIALLELESPVTFDTHIVPICMPSDIADFTGRMATVTGWGRLTYKGGVPPILQEVQVPIIENSVCQEMFHTAGHDKKILNSFLCAGYANGQKDSCEGDSGGPLVLQRADGRYELAGTVSHGIKCAAPYLPGVYMRTTFYKPWLRSITGVK